MPTLDALRFRAQDFAARRPQALLMSGLSSLTKRTRAAPLSSQAIFRTRRKTSAAPCGEASPWVSSCRTGDLGKAAARRLIPRPLGLAGGQADAPTSRHLHQDAERGGGLLGGGSLAGFQQKSLPGRKHRQELAAPPSPPPATQFPTAASEEPTAPYPHARRQCTCCALALPRLRSRVWASDSPSGRPIQRIFLPLTAAAASAPRQAPASPCGRSFGGEARRGVRWADARQ